jgi:ribA/ribD-fused uncharacterized protein
MKPEDFGYVCKNNIVLFQKGPLSQWWGAYKGQNSNFSPVGGPFGTSGETVFNCCEQWMMAAKAVLMNDEFAAKRILALKSPKRQKEEGRKIENFDPAVWDKHKRNVVYWGNLWKFSQNPELKEFLLSFPRHTIFAEAAPWDPVWGIGLGPENPDALITSRWKGQNLLGEAIQRVHRELY